jgi:hypothetical protein
VYPPLRRANSSQAERPAGKDLDLSLKLQVAAALAACGYYTRVNVLPAGHKFPWFGRCDGHECSGDPLRPECLSGLHARRVTFAVLRETVLLTARDPVVTETVKIKWRSSAQPAYYDIICKPFAVGQTRTGAPMRSVAPLNLREIKT